MREVKDEDRGQDPEVKTDLEGHVPEIVLEKEDDHQEIEKGHLLVTGDHVPTAIHNQRKNVHIPKISNRIPKIDIHSQNHALHQRNVHTLESDRFLMTGLAVAQLQLMVKITKVVKISGTVIITTRIEKAATETNSIRNSRIYSIYPSIS